MAFLYHALALLRQVADTAHREHAGRSIVNVPIVHRERSGATLGCWSAVELSLLSA